MIILFLLFSLFFGAVNAQDDTEAFVDDMFSELSIEGFEYDLQQLVTNSVDWQEPLLLKLRLQQSKDLDEYFETNVYNGNEYIDAVILRLSDYYKNNDLIPGYIDFFANYLFFDVNDKEIVKNRVHEFSSRYKAQKKDSELYLDILFTSFRYYLEDESSFIGDLLYGELSKYYDGNPEMISRHFPLGLRTVSIRGRKTYNLINSRMRTFIQVQKGKDISKIKVLRKRYLLDKNILRTENKNIDPVTLLNNYLPEHLRSLDLRTTTDSFIRLIVQTKYCKIGPDEQEVLFGVDNSGGLYDCWMKDMSSEYNQSMLVLFGVFAYESGLFESRSVSKLVSSAYLQLGLIYNVGISSPKTDIKVLEYNTGIRFNSFAVEKYNRGLESLLSKGLVR